MSTARKGRATEYEFRDLLKKLGWELVVRSAGSKGPFDLIAFASVNRKTAKSFAYDPASPSENFTPNFVSYTSLGCWIAILVCRKGSGTMPTKERRLTAAGMAERFGGTAFVAIRRMGRGGRKKRWEIERL